MARESVSHMHAALRNRRSAPFLAPHTPALTLGDRLRGNAELLELALRTRRCGRRALRALAADLVAHAAEADRLAEAEVWVDAASRAPSVRRRAA